MQSFARDTQVQAFLRHFRAGFNPLQGTLFYIIDVIYDIILK